MFEAVGYGVERLLRIRIGNLRLGDLPCGHWRALTKSELRSLGASFGEPVSGVAELRPRL
jgi:16S rRNA U516 pseudouridylate synthase RsuA-like enzyme